MNSEIVHFICWKWKSEKNRYDHTHVNKFVRGLKRHYQKPHRIICITDDPKGIRGGCETFPLWSDHSSLRNPSGKHLPSCYRRLKIFSPVLQSELNIDPGERIVSIDLDVVFTGNLEPMFYNRSEEYIGWKGVGTYHPIVYNGTVFAFKAGAKQELWDDFDPERTPAIVSKEKFFGSDQAWMSYKLAGSVPGYGVRDGMYSYSRDIRAARVDLPRNAKIVSFNGKHKPWHTFVHARAPWVKDHWI